MHNVTESEARKEALAAEAKDCIKRGTHWVAHWEDWCFIADGLAVGRMRAMRLAGTNQPFGSAYNRAFSAWMAERSWAGPQSINKVTRSHLLWVADHRSEIEAWRVTLTQNERDKMNHPTTLKRKYDAAHKVAIDGAPKKATRAHALVRENTELWDKVQRLERERAGGSLFDLCETPVEDIANIIAETVALGRLQQLQTEIAKQIAKRKLTALTR